MSDYYSRIRSDQQRSNVNSSRNDDDDTVRRPKNDPKDPDKFKKILDDPDDSKDLAQKGVRAKDRMGKGDPEVESKEMMDSIVKKTMQSEVDPRFNQVPTLAKDTKLAPKLGSEITIAPSEEPRALAALEGLEKNKMMVKKGEDASLIKEMALDKAEMKTKNNSMLPPDKSELKKKTSSTSLYDLISGSNKLDEKKSENNIAYVDLINVKPSGAVAPSLEKAGLTSAQLQNLIDQITIHLKSLENQTQMDTTLELKNLAAFNGATVTVSTYSTAKGEINISFENLTQQGKHILDLAENRTALQQALDQKGYTVHMIVTSTVERQYNDVNIAQNQKDQRGDGSQGQFEREQQKQQKQQK